MANFPPFPIAADGTFEHAKCIAHILQHDKGMEYLPTEDDIAMVNDLLAFISFKFGIQIFRLFSRNRSNRLVQCKTMFLYFCGANSKMSQKCMAAFVSLDHTAVAFARNRHESFAKDSNSKYDTYRETVTALENTEHSIFEKKLEAPPEKQTKRAARELCTRFAQFLGHSNIDHKIEAFMKIEFPEDEQAEN